VRRRDREIADFDEVIAVMKRCKVCHVAFHCDEYPYVVPMNFGMRVVGHDVTLFFHGAKVGKKHDLLKRDNRVGFVMEDARSIVTGPDVGACECTMEFDSVMGTGVMDYVDDADKVESLHAILSQYSVSEGDNYHFHDEVVPSISVLELRVHSLSAKRRRVGQSHLDTCRHMGEASKTRCPS